MANPDSILEGQGLHLDMVVAPDGTVGMKAGGEQIAVAGAGDPSLPQLVTQVSFLTGTGYQAVAAGPVETALVPDPTPCRRLTIKADLGNVDPMYVGLTGLSADTDNLTGGYRLYPGETFVLGTADVSTVFILGTADEGVSFAYEL